MGAFIGKSIKEPMARLPSVWGAGKPTREAGGLFKVFKNYSYTKDGKPITEEEFRKGTYKKLNPDVKETYWDKEKNLIKAGVDPKLVKEKEKKTVKKKMTKKTKTPLTKQKVLMARQVGSGQTIKKTLMG